MSSSSPTRTSSRLLPALRVLSALAVLNVLYQSITAGQLFTRNGLPLEAHGGGAIALHVLTGVTAVVAGLLWRRGGIGIGVPVLAAVVFLATFAQAALGHFNTLWAHIPGAMLLSVGTVWVLLSALRTPTRND